jgi:hypothetical protein
VGPETGLDDMTNARFHRHPLHPPPPRARCSSEIPVQSYSDGTPSDSCTSKLIQSLIEEGRCPTNSELGNRMGVALKELEQMLRSLADIHGVVLQPHTCEPWVIHPFSLTPTINWIEKAGTSWWAPCVWCALGVTALVGDDCCIHTRYRAEGEALTI